MWNWARNRNILLQKRKLLTNHAAARPVPSGLRFSPVPNKTVVHSFLAAFLACLAGALAAGSAHATVRMEQVYPARAAANPTERAILFSGEDRQTIDHFFRRQNTQRDTNGAKPPREPLLIRERVPQGVPTRPLPYALDHQLPPLPPGYARLILGRDVLLVERRSLTILDIVREVVR